MVQLQCQMDPGKTSKNKTTSELIEARTNLYKNGAKQKWHQTPGY